MKKRFIAMGLIQGFILCALYHIAQQKTDYTTPDPTWIFPCLIMTLFMPVTVYATEFIEGLPPAKRWGLIIGIGVVLLGCSTYESMIHTLGRGHAEFFISVIIWGFVVIHLGVGLLANHQGKLFSATRYHFMFENAWRNGVMLALACGVSGLFYGVLMSIGALFNTIGIRFMTTLLATPIITVPLLTVTGALVCGYTAQQQKTITAIRNLILTVTQWLSPIVVTFSAIWLVALLLDFNDQFLHGSKGLILLWVCALSVAFLNAAYQDGINRAPFPKWLMRATMYVWPVVSVISALAVYAMTLRVQEHGWSSDRVWGMLVAVMALIYAVGYSLSILPSKTSQWMWSVSGTNIVAALCLVVLIPVIISPIAHPKKLEVHSQFKRLQTQAITPDEFNFSRYIGPYSSYRYFSKGMLKSFQEGMDHPQKKRITLLANLALDEGNSPEKKEAPVTVQALVDALKLITPNTTPEADITRLADTLIAEDEYARNCIHRFTCTALWADITPHKGKEALIQTESYNDCFYVYGINADGEYKRQGRLCQDTQNDEFDIRSISPESNISTHTSTWKELEIDGVRFMKDHYHD